MRVTMREIGQMFGVSAVTVSKALAGKSGVSDEMREKIRAKAAELGYSVPGTQHALDIGVVISHRFFDDESFYSMMYRLLVNALSEKGHFALLELLSDEMEQQNILPNLLRSRHVDAIVMLGQPKKDYLRMIAQQPTPVVFLDFYDEDASADAVVGDSAYGSYRLTTHLIHGGHTDIGFVGEPLATSSIMDRYLGFYRAMLSHKLSVREDRVIPDRDAQGDLLPIVLPDDLPTALVCCCDLTACTVLELLKARGVRVPQDISVVGFDDFTGGGRPAVPLSTFRMDYEAMAARTVQLLEHCCTGERSGTDRVVIGGRPVYRSSDGAVPGNEEQKR